MKILFDSYYFFPFIQVSVDQLASDQLLAYLQHPQLMIYRSEMTMFELTAKGSKYICNHVLDIKDLTTGLNTLQLTKNIQVIPIYLSEIQMLANQFHEAHTDFIDCLILASAACFTDALVTEDHDLIEKSRAHWCAILRSVNRGFQVITMAQFQTEIAP